MTSSLIYLGRFKNFFSTRQLRCSLVCRKLTGFIAIDRGRLNTPSLNKLFSFSENIMSSSSFSINLAPSHFLKWAPSSNHHHHHHQQHHHPSQHVSSVAIAGNPPTVAVMLYLSCMQVMSMFMRQKHHPPHFLIKLSIFL